MSVFHMLSDYFEHSWSSCSLSQAALSDKELITNLNFSFFAANTSQLSVQKIYESHTEKLNNFIQNDLKISDKKWLNSAELSHKNKRKNLWFLWLQDYWSDQFVNQICFFKHSAEIRSLITAYQKT